jgi:hypothetical protein
MAIAAIDDGANLHIVKWTGRVRLHAGAQSYCTKAFDAADGVMQVPDEVFTQNRPMTVAPGQKRSPCGSCRTAYQAVLG